jgi:streptogramin lyase
MDRTDRALRRAALGITLALLASEALGAPAPLPQRVQRIEGPPGSHAFLAADHQAVPIDLGALGYVEEEFLVAGTAGIYDWPDGREPVARVHGPYATRILVRRPRDARRFSGTVIVEGLNPSTPVDLPIMWGHSHRQFIADGHAWVGVTVKPYTLRSLRRFDPVRYGELSMAHPAGGPVCAEGAINRWSQPSTPAEETGLAWDILTQLGALLKSGGAANPLHVTAKRLYMTGQSQTAGYARTWASVFAPYTQAQSGGPLYDGFLYSGSPPWQVPLHQCATSFADEDPRSRTAPAGVPVIELFAQGDLGTNFISRRADSDRAPDLYRRYEVAGAAHVDPWEGRSFADAVDARRATGQEAGPPLACQPAGVQDTDFPARHAINAAWRHLDAWVRKASAAPRAQPLQMRVPLAEPFDPERAFFTDDVGNAKGGVRSPLVDVPVARYVGAKTGAFSCMFDGYMYSFDAAQLRQLHGDARQYLRRVQASAEQLRREGWLTAEDARELVAEARARDIAFAQVKALALPANSGPVTVTTSRDGSVWFTAGQGNYIGRFNADGSGLKQFALPNANSAPRIIALGGDGNAWFSEHNGNRIGRLTPRGELAEFPIPTPDSQPRAIALGADGNIWFGEFAAGKIGRITPQGVITEFTIPTPGSGPRALAAGPDGNIWFSEFRAGKIGRITPQGVITEFALPRANSGPGDITTGADGALWFVELSGSMDGMQPDGARLGRITVEGRITEFDMPSKLPSPINIAVGPDRNIWFTQGTKVVRATAEGKFMEFELGAGSRGSGLSAGADRQPPKRLGTRLYVADGGANRIAWLEFTPAR